MLLAGNTNFTETLQTTFAKNLIYKQRFIMVILKRGNCTSDKIIKCFPIKFTIIWKFHLHAFVALRDFNKERKRISLGMNRIFQTKMNSIWIEFVMIEDKPFAQTLEWELCITFITFPCCLIMRSFNWNTIIFLKSQYRLSLDNIYLGEVNDCNNKL